MTHNSGTFLGSKGLEGSAGQLKVFPIPPGKSAKLSIDKLTQGVRRPGQLKFNLGFDRIFSLVLLVMGHSLYSCSRSEYFACIGTLFWVGRCHHKCCRLKKWVSTVRNVRNPHLGITHTQCSAFRIFSSYIWKGILCYFVHASVRSSWSKNIWTKKLYLSIFGRQFSLILTRGTVG